MKNKYISLFTAMALSFSLVACGSNASTSTVESSAQEESTSSEDTKSEDTNSGADSEATDAGKTDADAATDNSDATADDAAADNASEAEDKGIAPADIYKQITDSVSLISPVEFEDDFLENYYGIDLTLLDSYVCEMSEDATSAETVFIVKVLDEKDADTIAESVTMVRDDKAAEMQDYLPKQYEIVEKSTVETSGKYVWLVISENADQINEIISSNIK